MDDWLVGGRIQRVRAARVGTRDVVLFQVRVPGRNLFLIVAGGMGVGCVDRAGYDGVRHAMEPRADPRQALLRAHVDGAAVAEATSRAIVAVRQGKAWRVSDDGGSGIAVEALDAVGAQSAQSAPSAGAGPSERDLEAAGRGIVEQITTGAATSRAEWLRKAVSRAVARVKRRRDAVATDLARAHETEEKARAAGAFVAEAARAPRGATRLVAIDWSEGTAREVVFPLDPARGAREQLEALFRRARRLREGTRIGHARLEEAERSLAELEAVAGDLAASEHADLPLLEARARQAASRDFALASPSPSPAMRRVKDEPAPPFRTYLSSQGARILVGRNAVKNDQLTLHVARPHDLWLHAKGRAGSHVVVPLAKGASCPPEVLVEAAHLAAHFSEAKSEARVEILYTPRKYVRKPKGSPPGSVAVDREKVMVLRRDEALLRRLLEREQP
jgi:hypothetical protein